MPFPGTYPGEFDTELHAETLALKGKRPKVTGDSFDFWRESVQKGIRLEWLRVVPTPDDRYDADEVRAFYTEAAALADASHADLRVIDYDYAADMLARKLPANALGHLYLWGAAQHVPKAGFWRIDTAIPAARISIMNYTDEGTFEGHDAHYAPVDDEALAYTDFWRKLYSSQRAVNIYKLPMELQGEPQ
jgi:hypothetical protein